MTLKKIRIEMRSKLTLYDIIKGLLKEDVSNDEVMDAIDGKYHVRIRYDDGQPDNGGNTKGSRLIQPMAIGTTKKGYPVVRAFQVGGSSRRGAPKWKFFRLDRITSWKPMPNKKFFSPPDSSYGEYNRTGDRTMSSFFGNAKFGDMNDPLERARAERLNIANAPKVSKRNTQGPIMAHQQWKRNVYTSQPNSDRYAQISKNIDNDGHKESNYWDDYEKAMAQADMQNQAPKPTNNINGPIDTNSDENSYDVENVDFDENNFLQNKNRR